MALLPEELGGAQEHAGAQFPAHDVGPLVDQDGQVAVRLDPVLIGIPDDGLGSRAHHQWFRQFAGRLKAATIAFFQSMMGHHRTFLGKPLNVFSLFFKKTQRDKKWKVGIFHPGGLEHRVQFFHNVFPEAVTPRFDHHAPAHG